MLRMRSCYGSIVLNRFVRRPETGRRSMILKRILRRHEEGDARRAPDRHNRTGNRYGSIDSREKRSRDRGDRFQDWSSRFGVASRPLPPDHRCSTWRGWAGWWSSGSAWAHSIGEGIRDVLGVPLVCCAWGDRRKRLGVRLVIRPLGGDYCEGQGGVGAPTSSTQRAVKEKEIRK